MAKAKNLTSGSPLKLVTVFALPLMFGNMFHPLYTVVDTAIVGRGMGMGALAAIGSVESISWMLGGLVQGFTFGFGVRISQKYGEKDYNGLKEIAGGSALLTSLIASRQRL